MPFSDMYAFFALKMPHEFSVLSKSAILYSKEIMILADAMGAGLPKVVESYNFQTASLIQEAIAELYVRR